MTKKLVITIIICGIIFGSVGVYAGSNFYANGISVNAPAGSNLGSDATLQNSLDELYSIADKYDELNKKINSMLDKMYPVGSIYISTNITSASDVAAKFGGTWEAYGSGRTIIGAGTGTDSNNLSQTFKAGSTGGEYKHTLTINEMPSHKHSIIEEFGAIANSGLQPTGAYSQVAGSVSTSKVATDYPITSTGGSQSHNNIQPYITVYMYKRIK